MPLFLKEISIAGLINLSCQATGSAFATVHMVTRYVKCERAVYGAEDSRVFCESSASRVFHWVDRFNRPGGTIHFIMLSNHF